MKWFYMIRGDVARHGIVDESTLADMARSGQIGPRDLLWNAETGTKWVEAITIPGLFAARQSAAAALHSAPTQDIPSGSAPAAPAGGPASRRRNHTVLLLVALAVAAVLLIVWAKGC